MILKCQCWWEARLPGTPFTFSTQVAWVRMVAVMLWFLAFLLGFLFFGAVMSAPENVSKCFSLSSGMTHITYLLLKWLTNQLLEPESKACWVQSIVVIQSTAYFFCRETSVSVFNAARWHADSEKKKRFGASKHSRFPRQDVHRFDPWEWRDSLRNSQMVH